MSHITQVIWLKNGATAHFYYFSPFQDCLTCHLSHRIRYTARENSQRGPALQLVRSPITASEVKILQGLYIKSFQVPQACHWAQVIKVLLETDHQLQSFRYFHYTLQKSQTTDALLWPDCCGVSWRSVRSLFSKQQYGCFYQKQNTSTQYGK